MHRQKQLSCNQAVIIARNFQKSRNVYKQLGRKRKFRRLKIGLKKHKQQIGSLANCRNATDVKLK